MTPWQNYLEISRVLRIVEMVSLRLAVFLINKENAIVFHKNKYKLAKDPQRFTTKEK